MIKPRSNCPGRFALERWWVGDLAPTEAASLRTHAEGCARCESELAVVRRRRDEFLSRHPFEAAAVAITSRAEKRSRRRLVWTHLVPATATFLALLMLNFGLFPASAPSDIRIKGEVNLGFYVQRGQAAVRGQSGQTFHPNDRIQFSYSTGGSGHFLFLLSLDDVGRISNFNYQGSETSVPIVPGNDQVLEGSIILDDAMGPERIFGIFSTRPLHFAQVKSAAVQAHAMLRMQGRSVRDLEALPLPYPQASILLIKR